MKSEPQFNFIWFNFAISPQKMYNVVSACCNYTSHKSTQSMSLSLKRLISIEKLMIHSAASVILNQVILLTLSLKVLLAALVHWFFLCPCAFFQTEKFLRFIVAENEKSCQRLWDYICGGCAKADTRVVVETTAGLKTSHFFGNFGKFWPRCALVVMVAVHSIV